MSANAELLLLLAGHLLLTALPGTLAIVLAMRRGLASVPLLLGLGLAASGAAAMVSFWAFYASPTLGKAVSVAIVAISVVAIAWAARRGLDRDVLRELATPAALWAFGSAFVLFFGFFHGGTAEPLLTATSRFSHTLPTDNEIPKFFADWFYFHGHHGKPPLFADWLASDRPPLQIGYVLAQRPFGWDGSGLHYEAIGIVVQQLWIVGMWAVLLAARIRPLARGLAIVAAMVSDIAIVHGFFVWPKLIAAAFLLAALAIVLGREWDGLRRSAGAAALFAALGALAMLAHGSSAFFLLPLLLFAALRGLPSRRRLGVAALVGVALLAPWSAYQHYGDPPGNRLVKWQLGGSLAIDDRGALETIVDGYREAGLGGALQNKWENVRQIVGFGETRSAVDGAVDEFFSGNPGKAAAALRLPRFYALLPLLGVFLLAPVAMALARARGRPEGPEWRFALASLGLCVAACVAWALLMFGGPDSTTMIHVGSLAVPLLAICGCVAGAYACRPRLAIGLVAVNAIAVLLLYAPSLSPPVGTSYSPPAGLLAVAGLAGFCLVAFGRHPFHRR
jgi:hypothetical protein